MPSPTDIIEWNEFGSNFSLYVKHFTDKQGHTGLKMVFEDVTREKVTEILIPPKQFPAFLKAVKLKERYKSILD